MDIERIQSFLSEQELDGWLLADFHGRNGVAVAMLELTGLLTRRSFYFIPQQGAPTAIVHAIEQDRFRHLPGTVRTYSGYRDLERELAGLLPDGSRVAMEYSPGGRLPYIGLVDAGTVEFIRGLGVEVVSSADLVASFRARLTVEQIATHRIAANNLIDIKDRAFEHIAACMRDGTTLTEYEVRRFILDRFEEFDMETENHPICAVDANAGNPHYEPQPASARPIEPGQLILIDLWAKLKHRHGVYADITWMAYSGSRDQIPDKYVDIFGVLVEARDRAVSFTRDNIEKQPVYGYQVDDICRGVVAAAGYDRYFTHRTGHSITAAEHGPGPNIDNLETEDRRKLQKDHLFSIEPGIYLADAGFRTEINVLIAYDGVEVTTLPLQEAIVALL